MILRQYLVRTASGCYVYGTSVPNGLTIHKQDAFRFDRIYVATQYAKIYNGFVETTELEFIDSTPSRAPQHNQTEDNAAQPH